MGDQCLSNLHFGKSNFMTDEATVVLEHYVWVFYWGCWGEKVGRGTCGCMITALPHGMSFLMNQHEIMEVEELISDLIELFL